MPVNKDESGRRWIQAEVEVPGTPEEVWQAIATGPGISSWFVPTEVEEREGGIVAAHFGPGMDSSATITLWNPPHSFIADSRDDMGPNDPTVATEWIVEARDGGRCVVRVVHTWFTDKDDWDQQFEGHEHGWIEFFRILRLYLTHFKGRPSACVQLVAATDAAKEEAWQTLTAPLGLASIAQGDHFPSVNGTPALAGVVERVGGAPHAELILLRLTQPAPGIASMFAMPMGGKTYLLARIFLYGPEASMVASQVEPQWQAWLQSKFPPTDA